MSDSQFFGALAPIARLHAIKTPRNLGASIRRASEIVTADQKALRTQVAELSQKYQVRVDVAEDGMEMVLRHQAVRN